MKAMNPKVPKTLQRKIFERDGYACKGCKKELPCVLDIPAHTRNCKDALNLFLVVDHVDGPSLDPGNLQALCWRCNHEKGGRGPYVFKLSHALKQLGPCMTYYPSIAAIVGLKESIFLCQLIYWTPRGRSERGDGWIYKSVEEMALETGLSYKEQSRVRLGLVSAGFIQEQYERTEHRLYFRVAAEKMDELGLLLGNRHITNGHMPESNQPSAQREAGTLPKVSSIKESRDYAEITHKNLGTELEESLKTRDEHEHDAGIRKAKALGFVVSEDGKTCHRPPGPVRRLSEVSRA